MAAPPPVTLAETALKGPAPTAPRHTVDPAEAAASAADFEAMFLAEMLSPMFAGIGKDAMFGGGFAGDVYRSLLVTEYANTIARSGGVGIADAVQRELLQLQENA